MTEVSDASASAVSLMAAAAADDPECAALAVEAASAGLEHRLLVAFCVVEACWSWAPRTSRSSHPVHGPVLDHLRAGDYDAVREVLTDAMTGRSVGSYAALLVQLAYLTADLVDDLPSHLRERGLNLARNPAAAGLRIVGPS